MRIIYKNMPVIEWDYDNKHNINVDGKKVKVYFQKGSDESSALVAADLSLDEYTRSSTSAPWSKDSDSDVEDFDGGRRSRQSRKRQGGSWTKRRRGATKSHGATKRSGGSRKKRRGSSKKR
jgi:hypothetical protein